MKKKIINFFKKNYIVVSIILGLILVIISTIIIVRIINNSNKVELISTYEKVYQYDALKKNTYEINSIKVENKNQQNDYYVCECTLVDQTNTEQTKKMTIMIKLLDNNNFSMSFSIK